jgi:hypothetical protein
LDSTSPEVQAELARRHKSAATTVIGLLVATILLSVVAFLARPYFIEKPNPPLDIGVRIAILMIGLGAIVWRRTKFAPLRLQDIVGLAGVSGLLQTLEKTTIQVALFAVTITAIGFVSTLMTGNDWYTYWASAIAVILLLYGYPLKGSWILTVKRFTQPPAEPAES